MFKENYIIKGKIVCQTGLHVGGSNDNINIGGSDNVVIRDSISDLPFIPGSSLKGKLRSLLELNDADATESVIKNGGLASTDVNCIPAQIFGVSADKGEGLNYPTRIIVRDCFPTEESVELWASENNEVVRGTELKYENTLNRINSSATPRNIERIPKGSVFNFEMIFSVYEDNLNNISSEDNLNNISSEDNLNNISSEDNLNNISSVFEAMSLLEDNYLGGSGSRGFGKVTFENIKVAKRDQDYYKGANEEKVIIQDSKLNGCKHAKLEKVLKRFKP